MTDRQINEFPTSLPLDTDFLVKQASGGNTQKCTFKQVSDEVLSRVPADVAYIDRPTTASTALENTDVFEFQRPSTEAYLGVTLNNLYTFFANKLYPVGSYYHNHSDSTNPSTLLGFGTWVAVRGRVLVGEGSVTDVNGTIKNFPIGEALGEITHTLSTSEMPLHNHYLTTGGVNGGTTIAASPNNNIAYDIDFTGNESWLPVIGTGTPDEGLSGNAGGSTSHNNLQPYQTIYLWRRTA